MFEKEDIKNMIKMAENSALKFDEGVRLGIDKFQLEDWNTAFTAAEKNARMGESVVVTP